MEAGIPTVAEAQEALEDPNLKMVAEGLAASSFVQLWLDTAYGTTVGNAMNEGIVNLFGGAGTPEDVGSTVLWLIRDAPFVTGEIVRVDGGRHVVG